MDTLHILIVDDDEGDRKQLKRTLKHTNLPCECVEAENIADAIKACEKQAFNCAIIDYNMPGNDGLYGVTFLHQQFHFMPIIMLTGVGDEMVAADAIKRGASDYIIKKNLTPDLLGKSILNAIEKFSLEEKLKEQETKMEHMAFHDYLTGIPNRLLFDYNLSKELQYAKRHQRMFGVIFLDLDRFKNINDTLGHEAGDELLKQVVKRLQSVIRGESIIARLGGDEFGILIKEVNQPEDASQIAERIIQSFNQFFLLKNEKINVTGSVGIAIFPSAGETTSELLRNADKAMYQAKSAGKNMFQFYTPETHQMGQRLRIENALHTALENNEFFLCYQPIYHLNDLSLFGVEALLRWNHPEFGQIPIEEIISVAEESGFIVQMGYWIINEALREFQSWKLKDSAIKLSLNISARQLNLGNWFVDVAKLMADYHLDPHVIIFELTETDVIKNMSDTQKALSLMADMGAQIAVDDFGMGYSSLNLIKNLPISVLKIDKSYIQSIADVPQIKKIVESLFALADNMTFTVIAEGIETQAQIDFLKQYSKCLGQGDYLSKPLPPHDIKVLLQSQGKM